MSDLAHPELAEIACDDQTRAGFLVRAVLAAGAVFGTAAVTPLARTAVAQDEDGAVLHFALLLERLEAVFYEEAVGKLALSAPTKALARRLLADEQAHVKALETAIRASGGTPDPVPQFDFGAALADEASFLKAANTLEDTGVSAYNGAAPAVQARPALAQLGSIVQVEARHAALVRIQRGKPPAPLDFDRASDMATVRTAVKPYVIE